MKDTHCEHVSEIMAQHKGILENANTVLDIAVERNEMKADVLFQSLNIFKTDLIKHLEFEDEVFYSRLVDDLEDGELENDVLKFTREMNRIESVVKEFLDKYDSKNKIKVDLENFTVDFGKIVSILMIRIEKEETSPYIVNC